MASEQRAGARAYQEIKQAILSGDLRQRQRLDIDALAARWRVSATPVRQALAILTAERLVKIDASRGYHVAFWSEAELAALYEWRWQLARLGLTTHASARFAPGAAHEDHREAIIDELRRLTDGANGEVRRAAAAADERLAAAYRVEPEVLTQTLRETESLSVAISSGDARRIAQRLKLFFQRRITSCGLIRARAGVRALPRNGD